MWFMCMIEATISARETDETRVPHIHVSRTRMNGDK
jgi:hypothetical protein